MHGANGSTTARLLASGAGWSVKDIVCTHGRTDRPFQEQHNAVAVALVLAGTFQYRRGSSYELLAPGALLLGNHGECFECDHDHATGDRCVAFHFSPEYFERIAADAGLVSPLFSAPRIPPVRELGRLSGAVAVALSQPDAKEWEEIALELAVRALSLANQTRPRSESVTGRNLSRITESIRLIEGNPTAAHTIQTLAAAADVSAYYYLRVFERVTGVTPHQFILRARLRHAARCIADDSRRISEVAFSAGFGDLSNFNHAFRSEFGSTPVEWRKAQRGAQRTV
jgi:AraC-like DNA-binding protein